MRSFREKIYGRELILCTENNNVDSYIYLLSGIKYTLFSKIRRGRQLPIKGVSRSITVPGQCAYITGKRTLWESFNKLVLEVVNSR